MSPSDRARRAAASEWEPVIGLEVHVQLATQSKAFSPSARRVRRAAELAHRSARARHARHAAGVQPRGARARAAARRRDRVEDPREVAVRAQALLLSGSAEGLSDLAVRRAALRGRPRRPRSSAARSSASSSQRIHLEEDAGKNTHVGAVSHVDLNRAGVPLVEVVIGARAAQRRGGRRVHARAAPARALARDLRGRHGEGPDAVRRERRRSACAARIALGTRTELKNINSFRFVQNAVEHEIARQIRIVEGGGRDRRARRGCGTPTRGHVGDDAHARRRRTTTATSPIPICRRSSSTAPMMAAILRALPELPARAVRALRARARPVAPTTRAR